MICPQCGTNHEGNYCPNGCNLLHFKKKKPLYKKWWFWALIALVLIVAAGSPDSEDSSQNLNTTIDSQSTISTNTPSQAESSAPSQAETTAPSQADNYYAVGDVINANGLEITYVSAEKYESDNMFLQPNDGYMYIRLMLSAKNTSKTDQGIYSFEFECYADGMKMESVYFSDNDLTDGRLSSGRTTEGYIYFSVPINASNIEIEYETSFWTDKKAILIVDLS